MVEENISQEFRMKNTDGKRNHLLEEVKQNELMNRKYKKVCRSLNYIYTFLFQLMQLLDVF